MPVKFELKIVLIGNSLRVTIPRELVNHLGLRKGNVVFMWADNSHLVIEKKK